MMAWVISLVVLGLLVLVHELGHCVVARWSGVRVTRFSVGFGRVLFRWTRGGTEYVLSALPLGGYVKMAGEHRHEQTHAPEEFLSKPVGIRARIVLAGPLVNHLVSILTLWVVLVTGYPEMLPTVGRVVDDMPAKQAGLLVGDRVRAVNGQPIHTWDELTEQVHRSAGQPLALLVERGGQPLTVAVTPVAKTVTDPFGRPKQVGLVGVAPSGAFETRSVAPLPAVWKTVERQWQWTTQIGLALWSLAIGRVSMAGPTGPTGPIGIVYLTSEAARMGLGSLLYLVSVFSLSLAVFNLFPIPILDGGHLLFLALEKLRGRPLSIQVQEKAAQISFAVLVLLAVFVCANDLQRLGVVEKVQEWVRPD